MNKYTTFGTEMTDVLVCAGQFGAQDAHTTQQAQQLQPILHVLAICSRAQRFPHVLLAIIKVLSCLAHSLTDSTFMHLLALVGYIQSRQL